MPKSISIALNIPVGAKAQNVEWLTTDYRVDDIGKFRCNVATSTAVVVEYTIDSGSNWLKINAGDALVANCSYGFDIYVRPADLLNFRTATAGGTTVILGRLDSIKDEG